MFDAAARKTDDEIAWAREATRIAELNYRHLLEIARPGMSEDELAVELRLHSKSLGAEDNFLLLCAGPHNRAVAPSNGRRIQQGDIILAEITPSYRGQLAQICRTVWSARRRPICCGSNTTLVVRRDERRHRGGACRAPAWRTSAAPSTRCWRREGYGEYCYPPHIRRRGHGLGFASIRPGDVALDNDTVLAPGMVFMIHPEPVSAGDRLSAVRRAGADGRDARRAADAAAGGARRDRVTAMYAHAPDAAGRPGRLGSGAAAEGGVPRPDRRIVLARGRSGRSPASIVYGSPRDHAELAYLTHFTPKLEPAIALIPRSGAPRILVGGGANMIGAAKPLTFVETLAAAARGRRRRSRAGATSWVQAGSR